jgi:hypothetical protein
MSRIENPLGSESAATPLLGEAKGSGAGRRSGLRNSTTVSHELVIEPDDDAIPCILHRLATNGDDDVRTQDEGVIQTPNSARLKCLLVCPMFAHRSRLCRTAAQSTRPL